MRGSPTKQVARLGERAPGLHAAASSGGSCMAGRTGVLGRGGHRWRWMVARWLVRSPRRAHTHATSAPRVLRSHLRHSISCHAGVAPQLIRPCAVTASAARARQRPPACPTMASRAPDPSKAREAQEEYTKGSKACVTRARDGGGRGVVVVAPAAHPAARRWLRSSAHALARAPSPRLARPQPRHGHIQVEARLPRRGAALQGGGCVPRLRRVAVAWRRRFVHHGPLRPTAALSNRHAPTTRSARLQGRRPVRPGAGVHAQGGALQRQDGQPEAGGRVARGRRARVDGAAAARQRGQGARRGAVQRGCVAARGQMAGGRAQRRPTERAHAAASIAHMHFATQSRSHTLPCSGACSVGPAAGGGRAGARRGRQAQRRQAARRVQPGA
jgi:hypothetical protein